MSIAFAHSSDLSVATPAGRSGVRQPVRLTRRGRIVVALAVAVTVGFGVVHLGSSVAATGQGSTQAAATIQVQPGDTLWGIAASVNPGGDIRATVDEIVALNSLSSGSTLPAGTVLAIPAPRD